MSLLASLQSHGAERQWHGDCLPNFTYKVRCYFQNALAKCNAKCDIKSKMQKRISRSHYSQRFLKQRYDQQDGRCFYCWEQMSWHVFVVDHYVPHAVCRHNNQANLVLCCPLCNHTKHNYVPKSYFDVYTYIATKNHLPLLSNDVRPPSQVATILLSDLSDQSILANAQGCHPPSWRLICRLPVSPVLFKN